jgi:serine/threonine protein phosphatase 1
MVFKRLFSRAAPAPARLWSVPAGERLYAIGDIHGRDDLLAQLLDKIDADSAARGNAKTTLIFLGDLPDRGPDSRRVIERLMALPAVRPCLFLAGNHEELMTRVWEGERSSAPTFHRVGGRATLLSYGAEPDAYDSWDFEQLTVETRALVPKSHIDFLRSFQDYHLAGDYLFVHAGIRPGLPLEDQDPIDMRWIRGDFVRSKVDHGLMIIHGHTITDAVDEQSNRIGIDTGAYESGMLTAIGLEGAERWFLQT